MQSSSDRGLGLPDTVLTELWRAQIPPKAFAAVLSAFGRLSEPGQSFLAERIIKVSQTYELRKLVEKQQFPLPHQQRGWLNRVGASASGLRYLASRSRSQLRAAFVEGRYNRRWATLFCPSITVSP